MSIFIFLLTFFLVLDCLLLVLLVLIQLPKKEAGLGQAFGGAATDALFGAGSGNALTKMTKYAAGVFFALTLLISVLQGHQARAKAADPRGRLTTDDKLANITPTTPAKTNAVTSATPSNPVATNLTLNLTNLTTNTPTKPPASNSTSAPPTK